jgi:integrase/recombinase XerD
MADNGLLDPSTAAAIACAKGVERRGLRAGNWLIKEQANELLHAPSAKTLKGKRDRAILSTIPLSGVHRVTGKWKIPRFYFNFRASHE